MDVIELTFQKLSQANKTKLSTATSLLAQWILILI